MQQQLTIINEAGAYVFVLPGWMDPGSSATLFESLRREAPWSRPIFTNRFGKSNPTPREMAFFADPDVAEKTEYVPWECAAELPSVKYLHQLETDMERVARQPFNSCAINHYRDGSDYIAAHSDNEVSRSSPAVAALSLGGTRLFRFTSKTDPTKKIEFPVNSGDLMVMAGATQKLWRHEVPKQSGAGARISVTYRFLDV